MMKFGHILTAMVTPFNTEGLINVERTKELIDYLIANGSDGLVIAGTTGESPTLSKAEKVELFRVVVDHVNKRVPVVAGTGSNNTQASIELTKQATDVGVDGIMLVAPYYNKPSQEGMYEHFKAIASVTHLPIILYNIPGRTGVQIEAETTIALSKINNIKAIKEASGDLEQMAKIIASTDDDFQLYTGDDSKTLPAIAIGADGVISVSSHLLGNEMKKMITLFKNGEVELAAKSHQKLLPIMGSMFLAPNPTCVKYALNHYVMDVGSVRLPLLPLLEEQKKKVTAQLDQIRE